MVLLAVLYGDSDTQETKDRVWYIQRSHYDATMIGYGKCAAQYRPSMQGEDIDNGGCLEHSCWCGCQCRQRQIIKGDKRRHGQHSGVQKKVDSVNAHLCSLTLSRCQDHSHSKSTLDAYQNKPGPILQAGVMADLEELPLVFRASEVEDGDYID